MINCAHCRTVPGYNKLWFPKVVFHKMAWKFLIDKQYNCLYAATIDMTSDTTYHANDLILFTSVNRKIKISVFFNDCWRKPIDRPIISSCKFEIKKYICRSGISLKHSTKCQK